MRHSVTSQGTVMDLLDNLMTVRHPHLVSLQSVNLAGGDMELVFAEPPQCRPGCDGVPGAMRALHASGLWIGTIVDHVSFDEHGRTVLVGVGSDWDLRDPFAGHPSVTGFDLRIAWRQQGEQLQLEQLPTSLLECSGHLN